MSEGFEDEVIPCDNCGGRLTNAPIITVRVLKLDGLHMFDFCSKECMLEYFEGDSDG